MAGLLLLPREFQAGPYDILQQIRFVARPLIRGLLFPPTIHLIITQFDHLHSIFGLHGNKAELFELFTNQFIENVLAFIPNTS